MNDSDDERSLVASLEADLASIAAADADLERDAEIAERTRIERGAVTLVDRLGALRSPVELATLGDGRHAGRIAELGADAVVITSIVSTAAHPGAEHLIRLDAVVAVRGLGRAGDCLVGISTSGNSGNVLRAFEDARSIGVTTIGLLGRDGGKILALSDVAVTVPNDVTARIQEAHILIGHTLCGIIEQELGLVDA